MAIISKGNYQVMNLFEEKPYKFGGISVSNKWVRINKMVTGKKNNWQKPMKRIYFLENNFQMKRENNHLLI